MAESSNNVAPGQPSWWPPSAGNGTISPAPSTAARSVTLHDPSTWGGATGTGQNTFFITGTKPIGEIDWAAHGVDPSTMGGNSNAVGRTPTPQNTGFPPPSISAQGNGGNGGTPAGGCGCVPPDKSPTAAATNGGKGNGILFGENFDCYAQRIGDDGLLDDARLAVAGKITNTAINANGQGKVNEQFVYVPGSGTPTVPASKWSMSFESDHTSIPGLTFNESTGLLNGTLEESAYGTVYKVKITAIASDATELDARAYTFAPSKPVVGSTISLVQPYVPQSGGAKITSGFGLRTHPLTGLQKLHKGQDWVAVSPAAKGKGTIVAAADGVVSGVGNDAKGYGKNIKITHQDAQGKTLCVTLYGHLSQILVTAGQVVTKGQTIGKEGSTGASTGPHLHFEVRLGGTIPVDPTPYLNGQVIQTPPEGSGSGDSSTNNAHPALTIGEVNGRLGSSCPAVIDGSNTDSSGDTNNNSPTSSVCAPDVRPSKEDVKKEIARAFDWWNAKYAGNPAKLLTEEDKNLLLFIAKIESNFDPWAKNPTSSATGLYQMLDRTAEAYYKGEVAEAAGTTGSVFNCQNRGDAFLSTIAMAKFYTSEMRKYWDTYISSGKTSIGGMTIKSTPHSARYNTLTKAEFIYGLIHHDGVGNAVNGIDKGGVSYYRSRA